MTDMQQNKSLLISIDNEMVIVGFTDGFYVSAIEIFQFDLIGR